MKSLSEVASPFDASLAALAEAEKHYRDTGQPWEDREYVTEAIHKAAGQIRTQRSTALRRAEAHASRVVESCDRRLTLVHGGAA
jgi:hypothetical protein